MTYLVTHHVNIKESSLKQLRLLLYVLFTFLSASCAKTGLHVINNFAKSGQFEIHQDINYGNQKLNIYIPKDKTITATMIYFYGGCWGQCSSYDKDDYLFVAETLTKQGYAVVIPDYRKYPQFKFGEIIKDAQAATLWTLENKEKYGIKTDNIFLMGHSAGAHMAAMLVDDEELLGENLSQINGFIGMAGPYDFYPFSDDYLYELFDKENEYYASQPIHFVNGNEPPHLLLQGKNDKKVFVHNAVNLAAKLKQFGVEYELLIFDKMSHAKIIINLAKPFKNKADVLPHIIEFVKQHSD